MKKYDISTQTLIQFFLIPLGGYLLWENRDVLFALFIAFILMCALRPAVDYLHKKRKLPRPFAASIVCVGFVFGLSILLGTIVPPIITETIAFIERLPEIVSTLNPDLLRMIRLQEITQYIPSLTNQVVGIIASILNNTILVVTTLVFGFYLLVQESFSSPLLDAYIPSHTQTHLKSLMQTVQRGLSSWFWGELTLMLVVGLSAYVGFLVIGLKYAVPLAVVAGLLEAVPTYGPTLSAIPAVLIGFTISPVTGFAALAWGFILQQIENNILVPYIMKRAVGISPIITMLSLFVGFRLAGPLGILLAIPTYVCVYAFLYFRFEHKQSTS